MTPDQRPSALSPFSYPVFRNIWIASLLSNFGSLIQSVGASWMMLSIAPSPDMVALVQASVSLPIMLLSLVAGAMADNMDRRRVMLGAQTFMLLVSRFVAVRLVGTGRSVAAAALHVSDRLRLSILRTGLAGIRRRHGAAPRSPRRRRSQQYGFQYCAQCRAAIGGAIVAAAGAAAAFAVNAASYISLITVLARWGHRRAPFAPERDARHRDGGGCSLRRDVARHSHSSGSSAIFGFGASSILALLPLVAKHLVEGGPLTYGLLLGAFGAGAVTGALSAARLRDLLSTEAIVRWAGCILALAAAIMSVSTNLALTMAVLSLAGAGWVLSLSTFNVTVQLSAPRWVVARALSLYQMAAFGGLAAGSWLWGEAAAGVGITDALLISARLSGQCAARPLGAAVTRAS